MGYRDSEPVEIEYQELMHETPGAVLIRTLEGDDVWIPKVCITERDDQEKTLSIPEDLAIKKDLV